MAAAPPRPLAALAAAVLLTATLGSIHAFSVFIEPLEAAYGAARADVALVYSVALLALTAAVLCAGRVFQALPAPTLALLIGLDSALGLALPLLFEGMAALYVGYGVVFGFANGMGYALALQLAARSFPARAATLMGLVTAVYALGAMVLARLFAMLIALDGPGTALGAMAALMLAASAAAAVAVRLSGLTVAAAAPDRAARPPLPVRPIALMWLGYATACFAGLMAIGHAAALVEAAGGSPQQATMAVSLIALANAAGGLAAGAVAERRDPRGLLLLAALVAAVALAALALAAGPGGAIAALAAVGLSYGAVIALYPALVHALLGIERMARAYGRVHRMGHRRPCRAVARRRALRPRRQLCGAVRHRRGGSRRFRRRRPGAARPAARGAAAARLTRRRSVFQGERQVVLANHRGRLAAHLDLDAGLQRRADDQRGLDELVRVHRPGFALERQHVDAGLARLVGPALDRQRLVVDEAAHVEQLQAGHAPVAHLGMVHHLDRQRRVVLQVAQLDPVDQRLLGCHCVHLRLTRPFGRPGECRRCGRGQPAGSRPSSAHISA
ncbi:MAG: MFS transporter [Alphaproteobacteria bacterium]